jgi:phosphoserine phosphatase RsbU-like protein/GAF domain-containing protein
MSAGRNRFTARYGSAFRRHLQDGGEGTLRAAYELGRDAVRQQLSVLDLAVVHHDALRRALADELEPGEVDARVGAAEEFFLEGLSAFEMVQRGYREARDAALLERQQAEMLKQLSHFLADVSLALDAGDSLEEMLRLVVEQARELVGAELCVALVAMEGERTLSVGSAPEPDAGWVELLEADDAPDAAQPTAEPSGMNPRGGIRAPLTALDGRCIGAIHVLDKREGKFTKVDEGMLVHLAQMASAAIERANLYRQPK